MITFFFKLFCSLFASTLTETAVDMTGKGAEREGTTCSKWAAGRRRTDGGCRGPTAPAHVVHAPPTEL